MRDLEWYNSRWEETRRRVKGYSGTEFISSEMVEIFFDAVNLYDEDDSDYSKTVYTIKDIDETLDEVVQSIFDDLRNDYGKGCDIDILDSRIVPIKEYSPEFVKTVMDGGNYYIAF